MQPRSLTADPILRIRVPVQEARRPDHGGVDSREPGDIPKELVDGTNLASSAVCVLQRRTPATAATTTSRQPQPARNRLAEYPYLPFPETDPKPMTCLRTNAARLAAMLVLLVIVCVRQAPAVPSDDHPTFWRLTSRDGLPPAVVYCIAQDQRGFMWFGTAGGLARYDGHDFRVFQPDTANPNSLSNPAILAIENAANGDLWLATEGGLDRWNRDTETFTHFRHDPADPTSLSDNTTQAIETDADGSLWIGTGRGGLDHFDPRTGKFETHTLPGGRRSDAINPWIRCLLRDHEGRIWVGTTDDGLYCFDPLQHRFQIHLHRPDDPLSLPDDRIYALAEDANGTLWVATEAGLCSLDAQRRAFTSHPLHDPAEGELPSTSATGLVVDRDGTLWVGSDGAGLCRYDPVTHRAVRCRHSVYARNSLEADAVRALYEDRSGDIWVGHFPEGVSHFDRTAGAFQDFYSVPGESNTLSDSHVLAFLEDPNGDLWVGTDNGGLNHWTEATHRWSSFRFSPSNPNSLGGKAATCVHRDHSGRLWVGTWDGGLNLFQPETGHFKRYQLDAQNSGSISSAHVWEILEDREKHLWIATIGGGVERYDPGTDSFVHHRFNPNDPHSLNDDIASSMLVTRDGVLWVGTPNGLGRWDAALQRWDRFSAARTERGGTNNHWIFDLAEDRDGTLWFTTEGAGLRHLDPRTRHVDVIDTKDGMPTDILRGIIIGDDGILWIGSNRGLIRFNPRNRHIRVFDEANGLPGSLFAPHARLRLSSGDLLFGTTRGFVRFNPGKIETDSTLPAVVLTNCEVFNRPIQPRTPDSPLQESITETKRLQISAQLSVISFQFAALSYRSPAQTEYRFKLEGFDRDWRTPGPERRATFTNLDAGRYTLRVRAANRDGVWNNDGVSLELLVKPRWWQTWWFRSGLVLVIIGAAIGAGWGLSNHRQREALHMRELQIARERTREREQAATAVQLLNLELERRVADRTAQLSAAVKELEAFSYSVSHDLRAPLRSVDGFSRVLLMDYQDKLDEEGRENLRIIRAATQRMGQLIDDLLKLAKTTQIELQRSHVNLSAMAANVAESMKRVHAPRRIDFVVAPDIVAHCDPHLVQIALENLLGNACKFTATRDIAVIEFGRTLRNGRTTYFVRDNGVGFDPAYAQKLFKAFNRLHSATDFPGSGIGLATVDRIVRRHGGTVAAESEVDRGATFFFTLSPQE